MCLLCVHAEAQASCAFRLLIPRSVSALQYGNHGHCLPALPGDLSSYRTCILPLPRDALWRIQGMQQLNLLLAGHHLEDLMPDTVMLSAELGAAASPSWQRATGDSCCSNLKLQRCWCQLRICAQPTCLEHLCWHSAEGLPTDCIATAGSRQIHGAKAASNARGCFPFVLLRKSSFGRELSCNTSAPSTILCLLPHEKGMKAAT